MEASAEERLPEDQLLAQMTSVYIIFCQTPPHSYRRLLQDLHYRWRGFNS